MYWFDVNVLVYASDRASEFHEAAQRILHEAAAGRRLLYLFWPVLMGYLRISTHPAIFADPLAPEDALSNVTALIERPNVRVPGEGDGFIQVFRETAGAAVVRGNLVPDAHVAALMLQYGVKTIIGRDRDFRKFDGIKVLDPFD